MLQLLRPEEFPEDVSIEVAASHAARLCLRAPAQPVALTSEACRRG